MVDETMSARAAAFVDGHPWCVLVTHRRDGGMQASPIRAWLDDDGRIVASSREVTAKARNLTRDPRFALCSVSPTWHGDWMTAEGEAEIVRQPEAMPLLRAFYEKRDGSIGSKDEFEARMVEEQRLIVYYNVERCTPERESSPTPR